MNRRENRGLRERLFRAGSCLLSLFAVSQASATIGVAPLRVDVYARPGAQTPFQITVINTSERTRTVDLKAEGVDVSSDGVVALREEIPSADQNLLQTATEPQATGEGSASGEEPPKRPMIEFEAPQVTLTAGESRLVTCYANLDSSQEQEYLRMVIVSDTEAEEMPTRGNTNRRIRILFRIGVAVFIIAGFRQELPTTDGGVEEVVRRAQPPYYDVDISVLEEVLPKANDNPQVLQVSGLLDNTQSTTYIQPMISASLTKVEGKRRTFIEEIPCNYGFNLVFAGSNRRFTGQFESEIKPGAYELSAEVNIPEGRPVRSKTTFEVLTRIAGTRSAMEGVIQVRPRKGGIDIRPGETQRREIVVKNAYKETIRVTPQFQDQKEVNSWFRFSPKTFVLNPGMERTIQMAVKAERGVPQAQQTVNITIVPTTVSGMGFAPTDQQDVEVLLRVLAPKSVGPGSTPQRPPEGSNSGGSGGARGGNSAR